MLDQQDNPPPTYAERTRDPILYVRPPPYVSTSTPPENDAEAHPLATAPNPANMGHIQASSSVSTWTHLRNNAEAHPPASEPISATVRQMQDKRHERRQRLKKKLIKVLKVGAKTAVVVVLAPFVMAGAAGLVVFEGVKVVLKIVVTPFALCIVCVSLDDSDY
ncbi:hypothetical protein N7478_009484 [Penicillium angulare]|uniref:uncharacterized protein n=1 Tax=Penicillium angulare TaxID=116970 RepID=UPI002540C25E|nr:uncharacterized protein N7478_009484 [Penicillium angulare]KAJ5266676.1 hypothetical protein N7478_009484 [Penicillium angulare]